MKKKRTLLASVCLSLLFGVVSADEPELSILQLAPVEGLVPTHYQDNYNIMENLIDDPFDYNPSVYNNPTSTTPAPIQNQVSDTTLFVPASRSNGFINGVEQTTDVWNNDFANSAVFDIEIPAGQSLKYLDLWTRGDYDNGRNQNLIITLYNDAVNVSSKNFHCSETNTVYSAFARVDLEAQGFTDNLLLNATRIRILHNPTNYKTFLTLAEVRVVTKINVFTGSSKPTILAATTIGEATLNSELSVGQSGPYSATMYLVHDTVPADIMSIQKYNVKKLIAEKDSLYTVSIAGLEMASYKWYALDFANNLSDASESISFVEDAENPVVSIDNAECLTTEWLEVSISEDATVYVVPTATEKDIESIRDASLFQLGASPKSLNLLSTYNVGIGDFTVYAIDNSGNISDAVAIIINNLISIIYENVVITKGLGSAPHYGEGAVNSRKENIYNDQFIYDPNSPTSDTPDQIWSHGTGQDPAIDQALFYPKMNNEPWLGVNFSMTSRQQISYVDFWGRGDADVNEGERHNNLLITLKDTTTGESWTSPEWSGISRQTDYPSSFGRFYFSTANVQPQSLLKTANQIEIRHRENYPNGLTIFEMRLGSPVWYNTAPTADAGIAQTVNVGDSVTLDASGSTDPDSAFQDLTYSWTSSAGITLNDERAIKPTFTAPSVTENTDYTFRLIVQDSYGDKSRRVSVNVTVNADTANFSGPVTIMDTSVYYVINEGFKMLSPQQSYLGSDVRNDTTFKHYSRYEYTENMYSDTISIMDTTFFNDTTFVVDTNIVLKTIHEYDTISVMDTLIIDIDLSSDLHENRISSLKVYPNPARDQLYISLLEDRLIDFKDLNVRIVNMTGELIISSSIDASFIRLDLSDIKVEGLYLLQIFDNDGNTQVTKKIVVE